MCFSATASFSAAATLGLVGAISVGKASIWQERPLAAIPLVFAAQQIMEGGLWLTLGGAHLPVGPSLLANAFAFVALAVWPVYSPVALALVEPNRARRLIMLGLVTLGIIVACFGAMHTAIHPYAGCIVAHSIFYSNSAPYPHLMFGAYLICTCLPPVLSSHKALRWFGAIVIGGFIAAALFYLRSRFSVFCFFAALASVTVYLHFATVRAASRLIGFSGDSSGTA